MPKSVSLYAMSLGPSLGEIREQIRGYDSAGITGVMTTDHLFVSRGQDRRIASRGPEPFIRLAVAGALSQRLVLGTVVVNIGIQQPALALRQFVELGSVFGGDRIIAGIGAGWNREEFDALGL